jgi:hypothetical protein
MICGYFTETLNLIKDSTNEAQDGRKENSRSP